MYITDMDQLSIWVALLLAMGRNKRRRPLMGRDNDDELIEVQGNRVYFWSEITRGSVLRLVRTLAKTKKAVAPKHGRLYLFVNSDGGCLHSGLSAYDHIQALQSDDFEIHVVADGMVASAGSLLLMAGAKRYVMPRSMVLLHQLHSDVDGKYEDLKDELYNNTMLMDVVVDIYEKHTNMSAEDIRGRLQREMYLCARECISLGVADGVFCKETAATAVREMISAM